MEKKYTDIFEERAVALIDQLANKTFAQKASLMEQASIIIRKSANPESDKMFNFFKGMSLQLKALDEKNNTKSVELFDRSLGFFSKNSEKGKMPKEYHETLLRKYKRQLLLYEKNLSMQSELFLNIAREQKELKLTLPYHSSLGVHHFYKSLSYIQTDITNALFEINISLKEFSKAKEKK